MQVLSLKQTLQVCTWEWMGGETSFWRCRLNAVSFREGFFPQQKKWPALSGSKGFFQTELQKKTAGHSPLNMDVSKNMGRPKSSILMGVSIINHPFWGTPIFWKHPYIESWLINTDPFLISWFLLKSPHNLVVYSPIYPKQPASCYCSHAIFIYLGGLFHYHILRVNPHELPSIF